MKKCISIILVVLLLVSFSNPALAVSQAEAQKQEISAIQGEKVRSLEEKYNARITPNDGNYNFIDPETLAKVEAFLIELNKTQLKPERKIVRKASGINGTSNWDWDEKVDQYIRIDSSTQFRVRGTLHILGSITEKRSDGKIYLSGKVTDCYIANGSYVGSMEFKYGSLGIQGSGTTVASVSPQATVLFEIPIDHVTVSTEYTWYSSYWDFFYA